MANERSALDMIEAMQIMLSEDAESVRSQANDISGPGAAYYEGYIAHCRDFSAKLQKIAETFPDDEINIVPDIPDVPEITPFTIEELSKALIIARNNDHEKNKV